MDVIVSVAVKAALEDYRNSLKNYPISRGRAHEKFTNIILALKNIGSSLSTPQVCMHRDLLQTFDTNGNPMNKNLRCFNYKDESGFQWSFSCLYDYDNNRIIILKMMAASNVVKEEVDKSLQLMLDLNRRLIAIG